MRKPFSLNAVMGCCVIGSALRMVDLQTEIGNEFTVDIIDMKSLKIRYP
jgi:hypothetical protein